MIHALRACCASCVPSHSQRQAAAGTLDAVGARASRGTTPAPRHCAQRLCERARSVCVHMPGAWAFSATLQRGGPTHWQARAIRVDAIAACLRDSRRQSRGGHETVGWLRNFHREQGVRRQTHRHRQVRYMLKAWCSTDRGQRRGGVGSCVHTSRFIRSSQSSSQLHVCSCGASLACTGSCAGRLVLRARTRSLYASSLRYRSRRLAFTRSRQSFQYSRSAPALARRHASRAASAPSCVSGTAGPGCMPFSTSCVERKVSRAAAAVRAERTDVFEARAITVESADLFRR
jgi:hypothetical protein